MLTKRIEMFKNAAVVSRILQFVIFKCYFSICNIITKICDELGQREGFFVQNMDLLSHDDYTNYVLVFSSVPL
jgi:hypothetical protein